MATGELPQDCSTCRHSEHHRREWGCDHDTEAPQFHLPDGAPVHSCPHRWLRENATPGDNAQDVLRFFFLHFAEHRMLPDGTTGYLDHPAPFADAMELCAVKLAETRARVSEKHRAELERLTSGAQGRAAKGGFRR